MLEEKKDVISLYVYGGKLLRWWNLCTIFALLAFPFVGWMSYLRVKMYSEFQGISSVAQLLAKRIVKKKTGKRIASSCTRPVGSN